MEEARKRPKFFFSKDFDNRAFVIKKSSDFIN